MKKLFIGLSVLGTIIPFTIFVPWLLVNGLNLSLFVSEWFSTPISNFFATDFIITWLSWLVFIFVDHKKKTLNYGGYLSWVTFA